MIRTVTVKNKVCLRVGQVTCFDSAITYFIYSVILFIKNIYSLSKKHPGGVIDIYYHYSDNSATQETGIKIAVKHLPMRCLTAILLLFLV
jgi:hypothetical protein